MITAAAAAVGAAPTAPATASTSLLRVHVPQADRRCNEALRTLYHRLCIPQQRCLAQDHTTRSEKGRIRLQAVTPVATSCPTTSNPVLFSDTLNTPLTVCDALHHRNPNHQQHQPLEKTRNLQSLSCKNANISSELRHWSSQSHTHTHTEGI
jgi:hypothetical protein